ncbi:MAG: YgjV family protein [Oscillospiraceae bacterium]|nr:YgjV family protein [Oscillospiraceae bacterium]
MSNDRIALLISFVAMLMYASSYLFRKKSTYLVFQGLGGLSLVFSYLFMGEYFAMISLFLGLSRTITYFCFEKNDKSIPVWIVITNCAVLFLNYLIVNVIVFKTANWVDIILVITYCLYAIVFSFRNLQIVRYTITIPLALSVLYNVLIHAPIFTVISFSFELAVAIATIIYYSNPSRQ